MTWGTVLKGCRASYISAHEWTSRAAQAHLFLEHHTMVQLQIPMDCYGGVNSAFTAAGCILYGSAHAEFEQQQMHF